MAVKASWRAVKKDNPGCGNPLLLACGSNSGKFPSVVGRIGDKRGFHDPYRPRGDFGRIFKVELGVFPKAAPS